MDDKTLALLGDHGVVQMVMERLEVLKDAGD